MVDIKNSCATSTRRPRERGYSSAIDYAGEKGLLDNVIVIK
jgi:hypothetical protein